MKLYKAASVMPVISGWPQLPQYTTCQFEHLWVKLCALFLMMTWRLVCRLLTQRRAVSTERLAFISILFQLVSCLPLNTPAWLGDVRGVVHKDQWHNNSTIIFNLNCHGWCESMMPVWLEGEEKREEGEEKREEGRRPRDLERCHFSRHKILEI